MLNTNSSITDLPCGSWTTAVLTDDVGHPFPFYETLKTEHEFAPDECLAFCASNPNCTAFTVYEGIIARCEWTDVAQDSLRVLEPGHDHEEEHQNHEYEWEHEAGHEDHEWEHEYDHKQSSGLDYHDYDYEGLAFSMVMCVDGTVQDYPKIFEKKPCDVWLDDHMVIADGEDDLMFDNVPVDRYQCVEHCAAQPGCRAVMIVDEPEYSIQMCGILRSPRQEQRVVDMELVRNLTQAEGGSIEFGNMSTMLLCNSLPYIPDQEYYGYDGHGYDSHGYNTHDGYNTHGYDGHGGGHEEHNHPHGHVHVNDDGTAYFYTHSHPHTHEDEDKGHSSEYYDPYQHGPGGKPGHGAGGHPGYYYGNSTYGYDEYHNPYNGYDYGNSSYGHDYYGNPYYDYGNYSAEYPTYDPIAPIPWPRQPGNCSHKFAQPGLPPCVDTECGKNSSIYVDAWIASEDGGSWTGILSRTLEMNYTTGNEEIHHLTPQDWPTAINGVGIVSKNKWATTTSVRVYDDEGTMIAGRDFPEDMEGICTDEYWFVGRQTNYTDFTGQCTSENYALLKTTLSQPRPLDSLTVVAKGPTNPWMMVNIYAITLY